MKVRASKLIGWSALFTLVLGIPTMVGIAFSAYTADESVDVRLIDSVGPLLFYVVFWGLILLAVWLILSGLLLAVFGVDALLSRRRAV